MEEKEINQSGISKLISLVRNGIESVKLWVYENYANKNGYYQQLIAGAADNLNGRGTVEAEYTHRTSGGDADLGTGTAQIAKLKGKSLVWNQTISGIEKVTTSTMGRTVSDGVVTFTSIAGNENAAMLNRCFPQDHVYYISFFYKSNLNFNIQLMYSLPSLSATDSFERVAYLGRPVGLAYVTAYWYNYSSLDAGEWILQLKNIAVIDLTLMFGAGNEPSTVEEFEALFPLDYYDYNEGEIKSLQDFAIETIGFNQWDEEWELGTLNYNTGDKVISSTAIVTKNYIPVQPNTTYYRNVPASYGDAHSPCRCAFYDANFNYLGGSNGDPSAWIEFDGQTTFTSPNNAYYLRFTVANTTYNNDICINLCWSGYRNGEYEAYWKESVSYPVTKLVGKLNGEGANVKPFADGFKSAGAAFDEITGKKMIKRFGVVDLGDLEWEFLHQEEGSFMTFLPRMSQTGNTIVAICSKYSASADPKGSNIYHATEDKVFVTNAGYCGGSYYFCFRDTAFANYTKAQVAAALRGVMLNYELAEPEEYELIGIEEDGSVTPLEELPMNYRVDDFGTEERTPADTASSVMPPVWYDVKYAMNAVDILRRLGTNYIKKSSMDHILTAMVSAGIIGSYTLTYNATNDDYNCTVTAPTPAS